MFALGMAGVCGSFYGSFSPSGSLSRTSLAAEVGVKTQLLGESYMFIANAAYFGFPEAFCLRFSRAFPRMSGLMKLVVVGGSLQFFTGVIYYLPKALLFSSSSPRPCCFRKSNHLGRPPWQPSFCAPSGSWWTSSCLEPCGNLGGSDGLMYEPV